MRPNPAPCLVQCYWVLPGRLLAGEYPAFADGRNAKARLGALLDAGVDSFIDLTEPGELAEYSPLLEQLARQRAQRIHRQRFPLVDFSVPSPPTMKALLDRIDAALADDRVIYLHCWGGVGRTGMAVGCFLVRHGKTGQEALDQIADWWRAIPKRVYHPRSPETDEQLQFVLNWDESPWAGKT